jgi:hypothetical protein
VGTAAVIVGAIAVVAAGQTRGRRITDPRDETRLVQPTVRNVRRDQRINSQLFVTGQVSGLAAFRGSVPYAAPDAFRGSVPSGGLGSFNRRSVGVRDVRAGRVYGPRAYREPSSTVLRAGEIIAGENLPGSSVPARAGERVGRSLADELYVDATAGYRPIAPVGQERLGEQSYREPVGGTYRLEVSPARIEALATPSAGGTLFGVPRAEERAELVRQLRETAAEPPEEQILTRIEPRREGRREEGTGNLEPRVVEPAEEPDVEPEADTGAGEYLFPPAGEDVYLDLLLAMRGRQRGRSAAGSGYRDVRQAETLQRPSRTGRPLVEARTQGPVVVHGLAGRGPDLFNRYMGQADSQLEAGNFYDARKSYELAHVVDGDNPLADVGLALSSFGAGEPATAGFYLHRAMRTFPPIMETHFDLPAIMPEQRLREMLPDLRRRLDHREDAQLLLLATFLRHNLGEQGPAGELAERLRALAGDDPVARAYAEFILTGKRPAEVEANTTRPSRP